MKRALIIAIALCITAACSATVRANPQEDIDLIVGQNSAGALSINYPFDTPVQLPAIDGLGLHGWGIDDPGFISTDMDQPDVDLFLLPPGSSVRLVVDAVDPAMKAYTPGFLQTLDSPGDFWDIEDGANPFHQHPFWHIDSDDPGFDPGQTLWHFSFHLEDVGTGGLDASPVYTLQFTNVPEPASAALGLLTALLVRRTRRGSRVAGGQA